MELANGRENKFFTLEDEGENRYYVDDFDPDKKDRYNNNVYLLSEHIPEGSRVLDLGCGSGKFGRKLKEKKCIVYGLDRDVKAAECATQTGAYEAVFVCDITQKDSSVYKDFLDTIQKVDIVILSDILEHLENPTQLLLECNNLIKENGHILISVPNVAHADISLNLLNGKFNYTDMGILDNTHLKFFTKSSFAQWINQVNNVFDDINFDVEYLGGTFYNNEFMEEIKEKYKELYEILQYSSTYNNLQILFKLSKISKNQTPDKLHEILKNHPNNIVDILGKRLHGVSMDAIEYNQVPTLSKGERMEYEHQLEEMHNISYEQQKYIGSLESNISSQQQYIKTLNESLEWYKNNEVAKDEQIKAQLNYESELQKSVDWYKEEIENQKIYTKSIEEKLENQQNYIESIEESIAWYKENDVSKDQQIKAHQDHIKKLKESIEWYNNEGVRKDQHIENLQLQQHELENSNTELQTVLEETKNTNHLLNKKLSAIEKSIFFKMYRFFNREEKIKGEDNE